MWLRRSDSRELDFFIKKKIKKSWIQKGHLGRGLGFDLGDDPFGRLPETFLEVGILRFC